MEYVDRVVLLIKRMNKAVIKKVWNSSKLICDIIYHFTFMKMKKIMCGSCGRGVSIGQGCKFTWNNVFIGNDVSIGPKALFICTRAKIIIGDHVMFGPQVTMITGGHRLDIVGRNMKSITDSEKLPENDIDIVLEGDNWIGANSIILKGVTVGEGAVVAAGAVVTQNIPPYSIWGGVPAKQIGMRFDEEAIERHKTILNAAENIYQLNHSDR